MADIIPENAIFEIVRDALVLALAVEPTEIKPETKLVAELGAESIDFLDITFRLEQCLPIKIPRDDLMEQAEEVFGEGTLMLPTQRLTPLGAYLVRSRLGGIDDSKVQAGMEADQVIDLWTVQSWVEIARRLVNSIGEEHSLDTLDVRFEGDTYEVRTKDGTPVEAISGDILNERWFREVGDSDEVKGLLAESLAQVAACRAELEAESNAG